MARVTNLGINIFSHWNGRGMRQARRALGQNEKALNRNQKQLLATSKAADRFRKSMARATTKAGRARALKRLGDDVRRLGRNMDDAGRDSNRFRRALSRMAPRHVARSVGRLRNSIHALGERMVFTNRRSAALGGTLRRGLLRVALALSPALIPIGRYLAGIAVELGAMATAATIGFGGFAALALAASKRAFKLHEQNKKLTKSQREHVQAVNSLKRAFNKLLDSKIGGKLLVPMNIGIKAITRNMHKLKPLINAIAPIFRKIARRFADWMDRSSGFKRFVNHMKKHGVPIMRNLARAARHVLHFLGKVFRQSLPGARKLSRAIRNGAKALAKWADRGGFKKWLRSTKKDGPKVRKFFKEVKKLLPKVWKALKNIAPVALKVAGRFLKIANNLSPGQIEALMWAFILAKPALVGFKVATKLLDGALRLMGKRSKKAGNAVAGAGGKAKKAKGRFQGLKNTLKNVGRAAAGAGLMFLGAPRSLFKGIGGVLGRLGGGTGLISKLKGGGIAAAAAGFAIGSLNLKHGKLSLSIDDTIDSIKDEWHQLQNLGGAARSVGEDLVDLGSDAWSMITPWHDGGDDLERGKTNLDGLKKGANNASKATRKYANSLKPANKHTNKFGGNAKKARKAFSGFSSGLDRSYNAAKKFGKGTKKPKDALGRLARQSGMSRKELKKMGIGSDEARKMLNKFGGGAKKTANDVKNKAGGAFRNGAKNLKKNWGGATLFVRRTTRSRLLKTIHQTRAFRNKMGRLFNGIKKDIKKKWGKTFDGLAKTAKKKFNAAEKQAKQFRKTVGRQFDRTAKALRRHWGRATESVKDNARKDFNKAVGQAKKFRKNVGKQFDRTAKAIRKHWGKATESVKDNARKDFNKAVGHAKKFRKAIGSQFDRTAKAIRKHWSKATESVKDNARKDFNKAVGRARNFRKDVERVFNKLGGNIRKSWTNSLDDIKTRARKRLTEVRKGIEAALKKIKKAFDNSADAIKKIWQGRLPDIFKKPVRFFVEVVYNKGLRKAWNNTFARLPGIKELAAAKVPFAKGGHVQPANQYATGGLAHRGGRVRGAGGPTADKIDARLSAGEYVIRAKAVKQIGVDVLNRVNQGVGGDLPKRGVPVRDDYKRKSVADSHFASGGSVPGSRSRHNRCSYYAPLKFAEGGFIPWPSVDINEVRKKAIASGIKAAKKSKMLGSGGMFGMGSIGAGMSNSDDKKGFDWATNLYQDVAKKVGRKVLHPFMNTAFRAANGPFRPAGDWAEVPPEYLKGIMDKLLEMIHQAANVGCGTNGFAPFRPWRSGDGQRVSFRGVTLDKRTRDMCKASEAKLKKRMSYFQGSWSNASASAGTHAGGGAVDVGPASFKTSGAMRASGFAAWARGPGFGSGSFSPHVHGIAVGNKNLSGPAKAQVKAFQAGKDGLAGNRPDNQPGGGGACSIPGGSGVARWKPLACMALKMGGCGCSPAKLKAFLRLMKQESGGNPRAINNWDSNAAAGNASRGLMQVIPSTFRANHVAGTSMNIFDPLANMAASVRYIRRRYGCRIPQAPYASGGYVLPGMPRGGHPLSTFCGGGEVVKQAMPWIFDTGGVLRPGINLVNNKTGGPEELKRVRNGDSGGDCQIHLHFHGPVLKNPKDVEDIVVEGYAKAKRKGRIK